MQSTTAHRSPLGARGFFITGTDTDVGKTVIACALLHALALRGLRVVGMKPVAAGGVNVGARIVNEDVAALQAAANVEAPHELVNPYCFAEPIAPHIAAANERVAIDFERIMRAHTALASSADCVVVEGAGGFRVPLGADRDMGDLAQALALPVILVVGMRLGCLNHALLTASAIRSAGLELAGWVANHIDRDMLHPDENVTALARRLHAPLVARVPFSERPTPARVQALLDLSALYVPSA